MSERPLDQPHTITSAADKMLGGRDFLLDNHPIVEREYTLPTPMLARTYGIVRERVWARRTGVVFHAPPRMGKTKCALEVQAALNEEFPRVYSLFLNARQTSRASDTHMFRLLLEASNHALANRSKVDLLFKNATTDVILETSRRGGSQFVLIIDEMQLLNQTDLQQLVVFHNALVEKKIKMTTVSFAQPEIMHRRTALLTAAQSQIIARFLSEPIAFEGCSGATELKVLLDAYDEISEYPEGSGWSYTRFFLPLAYHSGFRLSKCAQQIWDELAFAASLGNHGMIPMEHVCLTIEFLLLANRELDCSNFTLSNQDIQVAVESSNLEAFSALLQAPKTSQ